jgi:asparagine synthase (glutamine-hydrolysing)
VSGIGAIFGFDGATVRRADIERMANVLKQYGPDRQKILIRGNVACAFCLHQLTPEDLFEQQPIFFANRFIVLFDGRIDNRSELGAALGLSESDLRSMPDSMIAVRMFDVWGESFFERILGVFAVVIIDLSDRSLICARDHMGLRVLHYYQSADRFAVATSPDALFALTWVPRRLNRDKLADTLVQRGLNGETTYYEGVFRVLPGSLIRVAGPRIAKTTYWTPENIKDIRFKTDNEYVEAFSGLLDDAVKVNLRSRRTPCATITGGLDSSSIAVVAAKFLAATGKTLHTYTAVPEKGFTRKEIRGRYFDETPYVCKIAEHNQHIEPHFIPPNAGPIVDKISDLILKGAAPSSGVLNDLWGLDIFSAARADGHNVILSGEMGNYTMSYEGSALFAELLLTGRWFNLAREIRASGYRWKHFLRHYTVAPLVPSALFRRYKQWRRGNRPPWYSFSAINPNLAIKSKVSERAAQEYLPFDTAPPRKGKLYRVHMLNCYNESADWFAQIRAKFGIDIRTPAFDRRLVEFCIGIPEEQYLRDGCDRWLIRRAMKGKLPDIVRLNRKHGVQAADWFNRLSRERLLIAEEVKRFARNGDVASIVDVRRLIDIVDNWPDSPPPDYGQTAYPLLWAIPQAIGTARFIENVTGSNFARNKS